MTSTELLSICSGKTKQLDIHGQLVTTAYLKSELQGAVQINEYGVEGNDVAVHTDHIYAFSRGHYGYWAERLEVSQETWGPGFFAETFLVSDLEEESICVGDVYEIGQGVTLSVAGPRIPCFKLCWRLEQPDTFIREFALSGRTGVYFNVLSTGTVSAGDTLKRIRRAEGMVRIHDIAAYAFGAKTIGKEELERILDLRGLSDISALVLRNKLYMIEDQERAEAGRWRGWRDFEVVETTEETSEIRNFSLKPADKGIFARYRAGQFLTVRLQDTQSSDEVIRVWSLSDYQDRPDHYRLSIKREPQGIGSSFMHERVAAGTTIQIKPPMGRFVLDRGSFKPIILIAGGIGITPLLAMLKAHVRRDNNRPPLYFIHCCRNRAAQPFRNELDELERHERVKILHVYDSPEDSDRKGMDYHIRGYLNVDHIEKFTDGSQISIGHKRIDMPWFDSDIYMCGPPVFQEKLLDELLTRGGNKDRIFTESFSSVGAKGESLLLDSAVVEFIRSGKTISWYGEDDLTLLELAESVGLAPSNSCRMGVCMSCSARLLDGDVHYDYQLTHSPDDGQVLLCSAKPATAKVVLDL